MPQKNKKDPLSVKITDFGFACYLKTNEALKLPLGSPLYMAPEIVARKEYNHRVDTWAIGVMAYIMLTGTPPFYDENPNKLKQKICKQELSFAPNLFKNISHDAQDFLKKCMVKDY